MITREQLRMARAALGWNVIETAERAGVAPNTITRYENGTDAYGGTLAKLRRAFEKAGLAFIDGNGEGPGVRFKKTPATTRRRGACDRAFRKTNPISRRAFTAAPSPRALAAISE